MSRCFTGEIYNTQSATLLSRKHPLLMEEVQRWMSSWNQFVALATSRHVSFDIGKVAFSTSDELIEANIPSQHDLMRLTL